MMEDSQEHSEQEPAIEKIVDALNEQAWAAGSTDPQKALALSKQAHEEATAGEQVYTEGAALSLFYQGRFHYQLSQLDQAQASLENALSLLVSQNEGWVLIGRIYMGMGLIRWRLADYNSALEHMLQALDLFRGIPDPLNEAQVLSNMGMIYGVLGEHQDALDVYHQALSIHEEQGKIRGYGLALNNLAMVHIELENFQEALDLSLQSLDVGRNQQDQNIETHALDTAGTAFLGLGDFDNAIQHLQDSAKLAHALGDSQSELTTWKQIGRAYKQQARWEDAKTAFNRALAMAEQYEATELARDCHHDLAALYEEMGEFKLALEHARQFHTDDARVYEKRADMRFKTLQVIHKTKNARNEAEIAHLRNVELEREVSERKQIEAALRESEARFRLVMEESPINISLYAPDGTRLYGNRAWRETWQPVDDSDDGFNLLEADLIHHLGLVDLVQHAFGGEEVHVEELVIHPEQFAQVKQTMWLRAHAYGLRDDDGVLKNVVLMIEDITKQKQTEAALRQAHKMESLGKLAGGIAHDFNNLLVAILTQSSLAYYKSSPKSPAREHIRKVERVAEQAAELSRQMLAYSGRGHFMLDTIDVNQLILESEALLSTIVPRQTEFVTRLAPNLPRIQADPDQLRLVLTNLLLNAGESFGGSPGKVIVATGRRTLKETSEKYAQYTGQPLPAGEYLYLTVEDDAAGMAPESLPHIFDPFFSTKGEGHGLGLSVVLGIVRGHKGGLFLESSAGEGSRFELLFPVSDIEARATPEAEAREPSMGKVLVIDDEDSVREAIVDILSMEEIEVIEAEDGPTGLSRYREFGEEVNLVVLDLSMPGMSGQETFQELLKIDPDVQVLLSSGFTESEILDRFDKRKPAGFLQKPYNIAQFLNKVGEFL